MKKTLKFFAFLLLTSLTIITLISCGKGKDKWDYSKAEAGKFQKLAVNLVETNNEDELEMKVEAETPIFNSKINKSNVLVFNFSKLADVVGYIKYSDVKKNLVKVNSIDIDKDQKSATLKFNSDYNDSYGIIINKNSLSIDTYACGVAYVVDANDKIITDYEDNLIKNKGGWSTASQMINITNYITQMVLGFVLEQPLAYTGGLFALVNTLGGSFLSSGATLDQVSKQISVIDAKIDAISNQIDANQKQILDEFVRTQAMIDEVKVQLYNQNITAFKTDYEKPIDDYLLFYKDACEQALKNYLKESRTLSLYYGETEYSSKDLLFITEQDVTGAEKLDISIPNFNNSIAYLEKNKNIVGEGLPAEMYKDISNALTGVTLPQGRNKETVIEDVYKTLMDNLNNEVLSKEDSTLHRDVLQFIANFKAYANTIAGSGIESVISSYVSRLEYIYNFSGEIKSVVRDLLAAFKLNLDYYVSLAQNACIAQGISQTREIYEAYSAAADYIKNAYENVLAMPDKYSYCIKNTINSDLYNTKCEVSYTNLGNNPDFHASFKLYKNLDFDGGTLVYDTADVNELQFVNYQQVKAISTRYTLLKGLGLTKSGDFLAYLNSTSIVDNHDYNIMDSIFNSGRSMERNANILTSYAIRDLRDSDSLKMECRCYGNRNSYYFTVGYTYKYRYSDKNASAQYWSGKMAYGDYVDSKTGNSISDNKICAYARYSESHWNWFDDEHFGFVDDFFGSYAYILTTN